MKLEVGMYVRSKINGMIAKITDKEIRCVRDAKIEAPYTMDIRYILDDNLNRGFCESEKDSVKASHNIIDLIEVGDYVNGEYVTNVVSNHSYIGISREFIMIKEKDIKSIVTKEQFENISYKVGE